MSKPNITDKKHKKKSAISDKNDTISESKHEETVESQKPVNTFFKRLSIKLHQDGLPFFMQLYPLLKSDIDLQEIEKNELSIATYTPTSFMQRKSSAEDLYKITPEFLDNLTKKQGPLTKNKSLKIIADFIKNSSLMTKLEKEFQVEKKDNKTDKSEKKQLEKIEKKYSLTNLPMSCAQILNFHNLSLGEVLFRIGDSGDRFYIIIIGKVSVLKPKEINNVSLTFPEYLRYCMFLYEQNEIFILQEVFKKNNNLLAINTIDNLLQLYRIYFLDLINNYVIKGSIKTTQDLLDFFNQFNKTFEEFNIDNNRIRDLEYKARSNLKADIADFQNYILEKCKLTTYETVYFEPFKETLSNDKARNNFTCFVYEPFMYFKQGDFFGDFALEEENANRNATIRAEENTILGWIKKADYVNMIAPRRKIEKQKQIQFLYTNFFFEDMNIHVFEKNYFHLFSPHEFSRNSVLFEAGEAPKKIIFLKEGRVNLEILCSVVDLHNVIKYLYENLLTNPYFLKLPSKMKTHIIPREIMTKLKGYLNDPDLVRIKRLSQKFNEEMNKIKKFQICVLTNTEILGVEELFLNVPYFSSAKVVGEKISCYVIKKEVLENIMKENKEIITPFIKTSADKIITLIERLELIKKNTMAMTKVRIGNEDKVILEQVLMESSTVTENINSKGLKNTNQNSRKQNEDDEMNNIKSSSSNNNLITPKKKFDYYAKIEKSISPIKDGATKLRPVNSSTLLLMKKNIPAIQTNRNKKQIKYNDSNINIDNNNKSKRREGVNYSMDEVKESKILKKSSSKRNTKSFLKKDVILIGSKFLTLKELKNQILNFSTADASKSKVELYHGNPPNNSEIILQELLKEGKTHVTNDSDILNIDKDKTVDKLFDNSNLNRSIDLTSREVHKPKLTKSLDAKCNNYNISFIPLNNMIRQDFNSTQEISKKLKDLLVNDITRQEVLNFDTKLFLQSTLQPIPNLLSPLKPLGANISSSKMHSSIKSKNVFLNRIKKHTTGSSTRENAYASCGEKNTYDSGSYEEKKTPVARKFMLRDLRNKNNPVGYSEYKSQKVFNKFYADKLVKKKEENNGDSSKLMNNGKQSFTSLVPEIVKNFYWEKKKQGYTALVSNRQANTLYTRKYHKKYGSVLNQQKSLIGKLPKIMRGYSSAVE